MHLLPCFGMWHLSNSLPLSRHRWRRQVWASQGSRCQCGLVLDEHVLLRKKWERLVEDKRHIPRQTLHIWYKQVLFKHATTQVSWWSYYDMTWWVWHNSASKTSARWKDVASAPLVSVRRPLVSWVSGRHIIGGWSLLKDDGFVWKRLDVFLPNFMRNCDVHMSIFDIFLGYVYYTSMYISVKLDQTRFFVQMAMTIDSIDQTSLCTKWKYQLYQCSDHLDIDQEKHCIMTKEAWSLRNQHALQSDVLVKQP